MNLIALLSIASVATLSSATPLSTRAVCAPPTDATCLVLFNSCANAGASVLAKPWSNKSCGMAAICYPGNVDTFLSALTCKISGAAAVAPKSINLPRITKADFTPNVDSLTAQAQIDAYYGALSAAGSTVWPAAASAVTAFWDDVLAWTGKCGQAAPISNVADYYQYSSTVSGPATSCAVAVPSCNKPSEVTCALLYDACVGCAAAGNPFDTTSCAVAAACFPRVADFVASFGCSVKGATTQASYPVLSDDTFADIATGNTGSVSQQQFIDAYYAQLSGAGTTVWPAVGTVIAYYNKVAGWTQHNPIPRGNFNDYFRYN